MGTGAEQPGQEGADASQSPKPSKIPSKICQEHPGAEPWRNQSSPSLHRCVQAGTDPRVLSLFSVSPCPHRLITLEGVAGGGRQGGDEAQPSLPASCRCAESATPELRSCQCDSTNTDYSPFGTLPLPWAAEDRSLLPTFKRLAQGQTAKQRGNSDGFALITRGGFKGSVDGPGRAEHRSSGGGSAHLAQMWVRHRMCQPGCGTACPAASQPWDEEFQLQQHEPGCRSQSHKGSEITRASGAQSSKGDVMCTLLGLESSERGSHPKINPKHQVKDASH